MKILKYLAIAALVIALTYGIYYFVKQQSKKVNGQSPVTIDPPNPNQQGSLLNRLTGDGKVLFDAYFAKFSANAANVADALQNMNPLSIFEGTNNKAWKDRFVQSAQQLPALLSPQGAQAVKSLSSVAPIGSDLWASVSAVRGANYTVINSTGVNLLPGGPDSDANAFVQTIACTYASCKANDKDRNKAANSAMPKVGADFQKIMQNWAAYNDAAKAALEIYTIDQLNKSGYKIV